MRHRRCRRVGLSTFHGFALWASPAVTHSVSPLGTVDEHVEAFRLPPPCISRKSVDAHTTSPPQQHPHRDTLASGGGVPCLTAGDARRVNPWKEDRENSAAGGVALQAWMEYILSPSQEKRNFCCHTIVTHRHTYNMHAFRHLYSQCDNVTTEKQTHKKGALPHTFPSLGVCSPPQ